MRYNAPGSIFYDNNPSNGAIYGKLYSQTTVMVDSSTTDNVPSGVQDICPKGWHVPSDGEWSLLLNYYPTRLDAGIALTDTKYWTNIPAGSVSNSSGFSVRATGYYTKDSLYFFGIGLTTEYWTASFEFASPDRGKVISFNNLRSPINIVQPIQDGRSCRCHKD